MNKKEYLKLLADFAAEHCEVSEMLDSSYASLFREALAALNLEALFKSRVHGRGHIYRVLTFGALIAKAAALSKADTELYFICCLYHDTGRVDDSVDDNHGARSAEILPALVDLKGEDLSIAQAALEAHSKPDKLMHEIIKKHQVENFARGLDIAKRLKDADGLDRARVDKLDTSYLRFSETLKFVDLAYQLFDFYKNYEEKLENGGN